MAKTKIVLNNQSDLILTNAQIVGATGIVKDDLPGLINDLAGLNSADLSLENKIDFITSNVDGAALDSLTEIVTAFQSADGDLNGAITALAGAATTDLSAEIAARVSGDESNYLRINQVGGSLDARITEEISSELSARVSGDESNYLRINQVGGSLDARITEEISSELSARVSGDLSLANRINQVGGSLDARITEEISSELSARVSGDLSLQNQIDFITNNTDAAAIDSLTEVVAAFQSADGDLNGAITALAGAATTDLSIEVDRATSAEASLDVDLGLHNMGIDAVDMWEVYQDGFINGWNDFTSTSFNEFFGPSNATNFALFMRRQQNILRDEAITQVQSNINNLEGNLSSNINNLETSIYSPSDLDFAKNYNYHVLFRDSSNGNEKSIIFNYNSMFFNNGATPQESFYATIQAIEDIKSAWWTNEVQPAYDYVNSYDHGFTTTDYLGYINKLEIYIKYGSVIDTLSTERLIFMESEIGTLTHFQKFEALINEIKDNLAEKTYELQSAVSLGRGFDNSTKSDGTYLSYPTDDANYLCNDQTKLNVLSGYGDQAITYPAVLFAVRTHGTQWYTNTVFPVAWWDGQGTQVKLTDLQYFMNTYIPGGRDYSNTDISRMSDYEYAQYVNLYDEYVKCLISEAKMTAVNNEIPDVINSSQFNFLGLAKFKAKMAELDNRNYFTSGIEQALWQGGFIKPADMLGLLLKRSNKKVQVTEVPDGVITEFTLVTPVRVSTESIYLNGLLLDSEDYTATVDGYGRVVSIDFLIAPSTGDKVRVSGDC